jgi:diacylglycerol kinase
MLNIPKTIRSFKPAVTGIGIAVGEANMRMHLLAAVVVIALGWYF